MALSYCLFLMKGRECPRLYFDIMNDYKRKYKLKVMNSTDDLEVNLNERIFQNAAYFCLIKVQQINQ